MTPAPDRDIESQVVSHLTRRLVPFLFLLYIVAYLDRINVGFAALQMQQQLGFNDKVYGFGAGMFFAGYFFFQVPSNLILARLGARRWVAIIMVVWGVIATSMVFVRTPHGFYVLRFLLGVAEAGFFPGMILYLKNWYPATARARAVAWFMTANPLAGAVGAPISGALLGLHQWGWAGWQWLFLLEGLPAVVLGGVVLFVICDHPQEARWLSPEEKAWLATTLQREQDSHVAAAQTHIWAAFSARTALLTIVYFGLTTSAYGIVLWMPKMIQSLSGVSNFVIGLLSVIPYVATAAAMVAVGMHSDRSGERRWHLAGSAFVGAIALLIAAYSGSIVPAIAAISLACMATFSMTGPFWATSTSVLGGTAAAAGIALINSFGNLGGFFGPSIIGLVRNATGGFKGGLLVVGATLACSGGVALLVRAQAGATKLAQARAELTPTE